MYDDLVAEGSHRTLPWPAVVTICRLRETEVALLGKAILVVGPDLETEAIYLLVTSWSIDALNLRVRVGEWLTISGWRA